MKKLLVAVAVVLSMGLVSCSYVDKAKALVGFDNDKAEAEENVEAVDEFEEYGYSDAVNEEAVEAPEQYGYDAPAPVNNASKEVEDYGYDEDAYINEAATAAVNAAAEAAEKAKAKLKQVREESDIYDDLNMGD